MRIVLVTAAVLALGAAGCRSDDARSPRESPPERMEESRGDYLPDKNAPLRSDLPSDRYRVQSVSKAEIVLVPDDGAAGGTPSGEIQPQAGRELRLTPHEFQSFLGGEMKAAEASVKKGTRVKVVRDADGKVSKLVVGED